MLDVVLFVVGAVALVFACLFAHLERWSITPSLLGLVVGIAIGPQALDLLALPDGERIAILHRAAQLLLAVALMGTALRYPSGAVRQRVREVTLLLVVVLPVMAAVLADGATWTLPMSAGAALVLGTALSPTDPVLAAGIVTGQPAETDIPDRGRQVLSLESGANDGLAQPLVVIAIAIALGRPLTSALGQAAYEVGSAAVLGTVVGLAAGRALRWAEQHREISPSVAEFTVDETLNQFLVIPVFVLFGASLPWAAWGSLGWGAGGFVAAALFLRRLPIVLLLKRPMRGSWLHLTWLGWFGPIGIAALFYLGHADRQGLTDPTLWAAGTLAIAVSTVVHGLSAGPARVAYRRASVGRGD
ncbi:cation:proton antiporter [Nitriliruptor alkaliphilus]|uniref:cation:proton antiporter domain-containing protein n=1 Tax=Nitriliruptor alkaliphilus TaxID=427918 RepID=UPI000697732C|nr:cation:proton antiporter [Nitriliruptor alkaliphilus]